MLCCIGWCQIPGCAAAALLLILWVPARLLHGRLLILGLPLGWRLALRRCLCRGLLVLLEMGLPLGRATARWRLLVLLRRGAAWRHLVRRRLPCACTPHHEHSLLSQSLCCMLSPQAFKSVSPSQHHMPAVCVL